MHQHQYATYDYSSFSFFSSNTELFSLAADGHGAFVSTDSLLQHCAVDTVGGPLIGSVIEQHENCYFFDKSIKGLHTNVLCASMSAVLCTLCTFLLLHVLRLLPFQVVQTFVFTGLLLFPLVALVAGVTEFYYRFNG